MQVKARLPIAGTKVSFLEGNRHRQGKLLGYRIVGSPLVVVADVRTAKGVHIELSPHLLNSNPQMR